jgi:DNA modification methylase
MDNLETQIDKIKTKGDFLAFMATLIRDYEINSQQWENRSLQDYLDAIERWVENIEAYYKNNGIEHVNLELMNWRVVADILLAAKYYE